MTKILLTIFISVMICLGLHSVFDKPNIEIIREIETKKEIVIKEVLKPEYKGEYLQVLVDPFTETEIEGYNLYKDFNFQGYEEEVFGVGGMRPSNFKTTLSRSLAATASTSETVYTTSLTTKDSHALVTADIGDYICMHINPGASNDEIVCCTGITSNNFTTCTRGYNFYSTGTTSGNAKQHSPGEIIIISNDDHYLREQYAIVDSMATISAPWLFYSDDSIASIQFGDGNTNTYDKRIYINNGDSNQPYFGYDESENQWVIANNGVDTFVVASGSSAFTGGGGIGITSSVIFADIASISGLTIFGPNQYLAIKPSISFNPMTIDDQGYLHVASGAFTFDEVSISTGFEVIIGATASISVLTLDTALSVTEGGTGTASWDKFSIVYAENANELGGIASGSDGSVLRMSEGVPGMGSYWTAGYLGSDTAPSASIPTGANMAVCAIFADDDASPDNILKGDVIIFSTGKTIGNVQAAFSTNTTDVRATWNAGQGMVNIDSFVEGKDPGGTCYFYR